MRVLMHFIFVATIDPDVDNNRGLELGDCTTQHIFQVSKHVLGWDLSDGWHGYGKKSDDRIATVTGNAV
jgi:hypothetical protein